MIKKNKKYGYILLFFVLFLLLACLFFINNNIESALALDTQIIATQIGALSYNGNSYLSNSTNLEMLLDAYSFKLGNEDIVIKKEHTTVSTSSSDIYKPGIYSITIDTIYNDIDYLIEDVTLTINKSSCTVQTLLNGKTDLTITEGDNIIVAYNYVGALTKDVYEAETNGVKITVLSDTILNYPAYVDYIPTSECTNYKICASKANSDYYDFVYESSNLTIMSYKIPNLETETDESEKVYVYGQFPTTYSLTALQITASSNNETYTNINTQIDTLYQGTDIVSKYNYLAFYNINILTSNGDIPSSSVSGKVSISIPQTISKYNNLAVIAIYNNGNTDVLKVTKNNSTISFNADDMGYFVVISPIETVSLLTYVIIGVVGFVFIIIVILCASIFKRKL